MACACAWASWAGVVAVVPLAAKLRLVSRAVVWLRMAIVSASLLDMTRARLKERGEDMVSSSSESECLKLFDRFMALLCSFAG
mmetsp:Transcript_15990/g.29080  ORF Transcript_15990/g.29080 Transcript_15990/m.29080 type:complete len:83 (-) Transcript_15990:232-480(-)